MGKDAKQDDETIDLNQLTRWMYKGLKKEKDEARAAELIKLFGPDSEGCIGIFDFVQAIDHVYKKVRLLENAVKNASHIDRGYERVINIFFYMILGFIVLAITSMDILTLIVAFSSLIVAFSFMIGPAAAQIFEGVLLVLGRQPYDIGDKISIDNVDEPPNMDGSLHWMVEKIDLVTTTARLMGTNEVASFSNGSIAQSRIINMNRSPDALVYVYVRFATDVPYSTIMVFRSAVEGFINERPQEWQGMTGFRANRVEAQENFVEYMIVLKHRLTWQSLIPVLESKGAVSSFCVELQKKLGCHYSAPSMPVEIMLPKPEATSQNDPASRFKKNNNSDSVKRLMEMAKMFSSTSSAK